MKILLRSPFLLFAAFALFFFAVPSSAEAANRYWVGGTGSWSDTTHWSTTSGGSSGAAEPTISDDVFFDANSGAGTVTVTTNAVANNIDFTGYTGTFSAAAAILNVGGSLTMVSGMTVSGTSNFLFVATSGTKTITSAGKSMGNLSFSGIGGTWQLQDSLTANALTFYAGTFSTNNQTVTAVTFSLSAVSAVTLNLGSSTITISSSWSDSAATAAVTVNPGTSNITFTSTFPILTATSTSFYDVSFSSISSGATFASTGNTFRNLSFANSATKSTDIQVSGSNTVTGTLTITGNSTTNRIFFRSNLSGTARTFTAAAVSLANVDFRDITGAGAATWSGTSLGNSGGNSNITFPASVTRYAVAAGNWSATSTWSDSSGGAAGASVPLPHDDVVLDGSSGAGTYTVDMPRAGRDLTATGFTRTLAVNSVVTIWTGSVTLASGMTLTGTTSLAMTLTGRGTHTFTSAGLTLSPDLTIEAPGGTYTLQDGLTFSSSRTLILTAGTLDTNNQTISVTTFSSGSNSLTRTLTLGSSSVSVQTWTISSSTGLTLNAGTSTITVAGGTGTLGGGLTYYSLTSTGQTTLLVGGNLTFQGTLSITGLAANFRSALRSDTNGTTRTITAAAVSLTNVDFRDITGAGAASWTGTTLGDAGGNSNITFTASTTRYGVAAGAWTSTSTWATSSGGAAGASVPLPQDDVVLDASSGAGTYTTGSGAHGRNLTMTGFTGTLNAASMTINGNVTVGSATTISGTPVLSGRGSQTLTTNGRSLVGLTIDAPGGTYTLQDALTLTSSLTITAGTFNANNFDISATGLSSTGSITRSIVMGSGTWTVTGTAPWSITGTGATVTPNTSTIKITNASASTKSFAGNGLTYNNLWITGSGTGAYAISGSNTFNDFKVDTPPHRMLFTPGTTQTVTTLTAAGTAGNLNTFGHFTPGAWSLVKAGGGTNSSDYLIIYNSTVTPSSTWYAGTHSLNLFGNSGWTFSDVSSNTAPTATIGTPAQVSASNTISFTATIADADSSTTTLQVQYSADGSTWASSTLGSVTGSTTTVSTSTGQISNIGTNTGTTTLTIAWLAGTDLSNTYDTSVYLRIRPYDGTDYASSFTTSSAFAVDTRTAATPTGFSGFTSGRDSVSLSWTGTNPTYLITNVTTASTTTTSDSTYSLSGLSCYTTYAFTVSGVSFTGTTSSASSELSLRTRECGGGSSGGGGGSSASSAGQGTSSGSSSTTTPPPLVLAPSADPAEMARLQLLINDLRRQIALRQQGQQSTGTTPVVTGGGTVTVPTRSLVSGQTHSEVRNLQRALNAAGFTVAQSGPGSSGNETTKFGAATRAALIRFQIAQGIIANANSDGAGIYGPKTRKALEALLKTVE